MREAKTEVEIEHEVYLSGAHELGNLLGEIAEAAEREGAIRGGDHGRADLA